MWWSFGDDAVVVSAEDAREALSDAVALWEVRESFGPDELARAGLHSEESEPRAGGLVLSLQARRAR